MLVEDVMGIKELACNNFCDKMHEPLIRRPVLDVVPFNSLSLKKVLLSKFLTLQKVKDVVWKSASGYMGDH